MRCECGDWEFRDLTLTLTLAALERACPRCRRRMLFVFRSSQLVATVRLPAFTDRSRMGSAPLRESLISAGLTAAEAEMLVRVAEEMAS